MKTILICVWLVFFGKSLMAQQIDSSEVSYSNFDSLNTIFNGNSLLPFYDKLNYGDPISILHIGDSHIEMGYFVGEMRNNFKSNFALAGLGLVYPYPLAKTFPFYVNVKTLQGNWIGKSYLKKESDFKFGVSGFSIRTNNLVASFEMKVVKIDSALCVGNRVVVYYEGNDSSSLYVQGFTNDVDSNALQNPINMIEDVYQGEGGEWRKKTITFSKPIGKLLVSVQQNDTMPFYIHALQLLNENTKGVVYHNAGVVGATFLNIATNASYAITQIVDLNPDLILFSFGSNEAYDAKLDTAYYRKSIADFIVKLKSKLPITPILLTSPPDTRANGRFPINNQFITNAFLQIAQEKRVAFWDLNKQMGGEGSVFKWDKLGLVSKDKLHFKKEGYELQAKLLLQAMYQDYNFLMLPVITLVPPAFKHNFK